MRILLLILVFLHAIIHLAGFLKAYEIVELEQLNSSISRFEGFIWLLTSILLFSAGWSLFTESDWWLYFGIIAIILSQVLIIINWQDAKFGTFVNLIILISVVLAFGKQDFEKMVAQETQQIVNQINVSEKKIGQTEQRHLPIVVQKWMDYSGVPGNKEIAGVHLHQIGKMRTSPEGKWMSFKAEQYFDLNHPSFIWKTKVKAMPGIYLSGRDKLVDGEGAMLIKLMNLFNVVDEKANEKINSGAMIRFLGEICWFPSAALTKNISWDEIDKHSAQAVFKYNDKSVSGIFHFSDKGELLSFEGDRYYGGDKDARKEKWIVENLASREFKGFRIPYKSKVTWKLPEGDFHWLSLEITDIEYY